MSIAVWDLEVSLIPRDLFAELLEQGEANLKSMRYQGLMFQVLENREQLCWLYESQACPALCGESGEGLGTGSDFPRPQMSSPFLLLGCVLGAERAAWQSPGPCSLEGRCLRLCSGPLSPCVFLPRTGSSPN